MQEGAFADPDAALLRDVVARLGVADVRAFGLAWEDCEELPLPPYTRERAGGEGFAGSATAPRANCGRRPAHAPAGALLT